MSGASELSWNKQALPPGSAQDAVVKAVSDEITEKGFVVANLDKVVNQEDFVGVHRFWGQPSVFDFNNDGITDQQA